MKNVYIIIAAYLLAMCIAGFVTMGVDKYKAQHNRWRIPEATLFLVAALGGSLGSVLGMQVFRHKTKHWYFKFGMPAILIIQIGLLVALWYFVLK